MACWRGVKIFERYGRCRRPAADPRQPTEIASSFARRYVWESTAPYDPEAFTINIGDLMARWTGDRWRSGRHRVLPPPSDAPAEELMSLVYFYECDPRTTVESVPAPTGTPSASMRLIGGVASAALAP